MVSNQVVTGISSAHGPWAGAEPCSAAGGWLPVDARAQRTAAASPWRLPAARSAPARTAPSMPRWRATRSSPPPPLPAPARSPAPVLNAECPANLRGQARRHAVGHLGHVPARSLAVAGDLARQSRSRQPAPYLSRRHAQAGLRLGRQAGDSPGPRQRRARLAAGAQQPAEGPIATIPYDAIAAFLGRPSLLSEEDVDTGAEDCGGARQPPGGQPQRHRVREGHAGPWPGPLFDRARGR